MTTPATRSQSSNAPHSLRESGGSPAAIRFDPSVHYAQLADWYRGHSIAPVPPGRLPEFGWIVPGLAAVFLYRGERGLGWMEGLVSNPRARGFALKSQTAAAIDAVIAAGLAAAPALGVAIVLSTTDFPHLARRVRKHGFAVKRTFGLQFIPAVLRSERARTP